MNCAIEVASIDGVTEMSDALTFQEKNKNNHPHKPAFLINNFIVLLFLSYYPFIPLRFHSVHIDSEAFAFSFKFDFESKRNGFKQTHLSGNDTCYLEATFCHVRDGKLRRGHLGAAFELPAKMRRLFKAEIQCHFFHRIPGKQ